jgi:hypothetical protein
MSDKPLMLVTAPVATRSGYGSHSRDLVRSLIQMDKFDIKVYPVRWGNTPMNALNMQDEADSLIIDRLTDNKLPRQPDIHVHIVVPNEFMQLGKYNIGITAGIETTACPPDWIEGMNRMDLNIVPSKFTNKVLEGCVYQKHEKDSNRPLGEIRLEKPIEVLFEGADTNIYKKTDEIEKSLHYELKSIPETFCFLYVGHWLQGRIGNDRKDTGMLVKTFLETFKDKVQQPALILKTSGATFCVMDREDIESKIKQIKETVSGKKLPNIYFLHGDLSDTEMNGLYNHPKVKAHVSFTHGEGFGRPLLEATFSEKPVITSSWSGHVDFLDPKLSVLLGGEMNKTPREAFPRNIWTEGAEWFTVNYPNSSKVLMNVYKNYKTYKFNATEQGKINSGKFSHTNMTKVFEEILDRYIPKTPKEVSLNLPKLKKVTDTNTKVRLPKLKKVNVDDN